MVFIILSVLTMPAQVDSDPSTPSHIQEQIESYLNNISEEESFDFNTLTEELMHFRQHPLDLNQARAEDLESLQLLSELQITDLLHHRAVLGDLLSIYELQSIASIDMITLDRLRPFVTVGSTVHAKNQIWKMVRNGTNKLYLRYDRTMETKNGFKDQNGDGPTYLGSPDKYYARFIHRFENKLSYGITMEKDPGEFFFHRSHPKKIDFISTHFYARDLSGLLKDVAIGDFAISLGQGLIMHSGFGGGKGALVTRIKRGGRTIRPFTSVNEAQYLRGGAFRLQHHTFSLVAFVSRTKRDANLETSMDDLTANTHFSSLKTSGLHRTISEIEDRHSIAQSTVGGKLAAEWENLKFSINTVHHHFNTSYLRQPKPYNLFQFKGKSLLNTSVDYAYLTRNLHLFGETAYSNNGAFATTNGLLIGLHKNLDLAMLYRNISRRYVALQSNAFLESSQANDEKGLYLGVKLKLNPSFWLDVYVDHFSFTWLKFLSDAPSTGQEYLARATFYKKRSIEAYLQYRSERKGVNHRIDSQHFNKVFVRKRQYLRLHLNHHVHRNLELRNRLEFSRVNSGSDRDHHGFMIYQDIIFKSIASSLSFTTRLAYFDINDYAARIYAYENDLLFNFSIPSYFDQGFRYYLNLRYQINRSLTVEARWEKSCFYHVESLSSGSDEIEGNIRTRVKLQVKISF